MCNMIVPCIRQRAEDYNVVRRGACVSTSLVIIRVAIRAWASMLKKQREHRGLTRVGRSVRLTTTKLRIPKRFARAPTRHSSHSTLARDPQRPRTLAVQVHKTPRGAASPSCTSTWHHKHWQVVPIHQADVIKIQAVGAVESELG